MSWTPAIEPNCPDCGSLESIETIIIPRARDLGGFEVRRALPAPRERQVADDFVEARHPTEAQISGIWADLLQVERVGVRDSFFELAGLDKALADELHQVGVIVAMFEDPGDRLPRQPLETHEVLAEFELRSGLAHSLSEDLTRVTDSSSSSSGTRTSTRSPSPTSTVMPT